MFDLKRPCVSCPFRKGQGENFRLPPKRLEEIRHAPAFQCHKTVNYAAFEDDAARQGERPQQCAGLMSVLMKEGRPNQIMQVAMRIGGQRLDDLDPRGETYPDWASVLAAHAGRRVS